MSEGAEQAKRRFADATDRAYREHQSGEELAENLAKNQALRETPLNDDDECSVGIEDFEFYQVRGRWRVHFSDPSGGYELEETESGEWTDNYEVGEEES